MRSIRSDRQGKRGRSSRTGFVTRVSGLILLLCLFPARTAERFAFLEPIRLPVSAQQSVDQAVEISDLNEDGRDDIAVVTASLSGTDSQIEIYLQTEDGSLAPPQRFTFNTHGYPIATTLVGETGEVEDSKTLVIGRFGGLTFLKYDRTSGQFGLKQASIPDCACDKLASWFDWIGLNFYLLATTATTELLVIEWQWEGSAVVRRIETGISASSITGFAMREVSPPGVAITAGDLGVFWLPRGSGPTDLGAPRHYSGLAPGEHAIAVEIGEFFGSYPGDEVVVSVSSSESEAGILFLGVEDQDLVTRTRRPAAEPGQSLTDANLDSRSATPNPNDDLLVAHAGGQMIGYYLGELDQPALQGEEQLSSLGYPFYSQPDGVATGDVNSDGAGDVVAAGGDAVLIALGSLEQLRRVRNDFNDDGISDLFWHHLDGRSAVWKGANYHDQSPVRALNDTAWVLAAIGDFEGDDADDLVWYRHGAGSIWVNLDSIGARALTTVRNLDWKIVGSGDFDGDGRDDLVWRNSQTGRNAIWKSGRYESQQAVTAVTDIAWKIVGIGDFNGDGKDDLLWRHDASGANAIWKGANYRDQIRVAAVTSPAWRVAEVADFNGDGRDDIFWRRVDGANTVWLSADVTKRLTVASQPARWLLAAAGDYDGDGRDDVIWRDSVSGANVIWPSANASAAIAITAVTDLAWSLY